MKVSKKRVAKVKLPEPSEHQSQVAFFARVRLDPRTKHLPIFAIPNGGARHIVTARKLKAEGVTAGVPDIFCALPRLVGCVTMHSGHVLADHGRVVAAYGLFLEMKRKPNKPTTEQERWIADLESRRYTTRVCYNADEAWHTLCDYLGIQSNG